MKPPAENAQSRSPDVPAPASPPGSQRWIADASLIATAVMWGINIPLAKYAVGLLDPLVFNAARLILSVVVLGCCATIEQLWRGQGRTPFTAPRCWRSVRFWTYALLTGLCYQLLFIVAITRTTAANSALLLSTMPMWTALLSLIVLRERLPRITWIGLAVTFIGTVFVVTAREAVDFSATFLLGNLLMMSAALTWAAGTVISRPLLERISPLQLAFFSSLLTTPVHVGIAWNHFPQAWPALLTWQMLLIVGYSGALSTGLAYVTWHIGVRRLGGSHAAVYQNVVTLVAVLGGWIALRETPLTVQIIGGVFIIGGLLIMRRARRSVARA